MPRRFTTSSRARLSLIALVCALTLAGFASTAQARVPFGFVGSAVDDGLFAPASFDINGETAKMVNAGIESVRIPFHWSHAQPYRSFDDVPAAERARYRDVAGVPTSFALLDRLVGAASNRRMRVLPVVTGAPLWAAKTPGLYSSPPSRTGDYARFVDALARRYGPNGTFWPEHPTTPELPIRSWQIWNEPNLKTSWADTTWAPGYVALLRDARTAIKRVHPKARIVLAGLPNRSFDDIAQIYRQRGARRLFDVAAVHPYTRQPSGVLKVLTLVRRTMRRYKDSRKPLMMTEFGWPSSRGKAKLYGFETSEAGQASRLRAALPLLAKARRRLRLQAIYHYTWAGTESPGAFTFNFSGLRRVDASGRVHSKPALRAFRSAALKLESCRAKASVATRCARRARR